ncbi:MAG TPA: hypothetical protein DCG19_07165 [Cryomorphaceae bacterium]|nr:hypothetical protein [Owenweeksia sp.]HAD97170.1 hypothetical protein [Cryomorphaceae bacterium]HBF21282.1 hypothetical protein [Cryomorphaceae bacterium]HCQ16389.1 hypothetical protein [Cryomorphaceae bacterium]
MELYPASLANSLDFPVIRKEIAELCQTTGGKSMVQNLQPIPDTFELKRALQQTNELFSLYLSGDPVPSTLFDSVKGATSVLRTAGTVLEESQFSLIRSLCLSYKQVHRFMDKQRQRLPLLAEWILATEPEPLITEAIDQRLDERAQVRSNASKELASIRQKLTKSRAAADRIFDRVLKKYREKGYSADFNETVSENRRVLAIQAAYKGQVQGIFHGSSSKHSIVYIEPGETVEINNEIAYLLDEERQEIRRILKELANLIRPFTNLLNSIEDILTELDFIKAKAAFAHREECCLPQLTEQPHVKLKEAYNPVLKIFNRHKAKLTVPLDLEMDVQHRLLVISGPNAGGKSITLKTLGLLQLMLQSGLLLPVHPASRFFLFGQLMGDIGDNQSIENELSTYSSKLEKMKHFLQHADDHTLLLIDEFGSGSDPDLGSALAQVFLEKLNGFKVFGILTTHYNAIKAIAAATEGIQNGAMLFDRQTFSPEYRLETGNPGSSYTFEVAEKSGIAPHIIKEARERTGKSTLKVDQLLVQIQDEKLQLEKKRDRLNAELQSIKKLEAEKADTIVKLQEKLDKQSKLNEENDRLLYWGQRFQKLVEGWMDQQSQKDKKAIVARFIGMLNQRSGEVEKEEKQNFSKAQSKRDKKINELKEAEVKVGDRIKVLDNNLQGTITAIKNGKYTVAIGNLSSVLDRDQFIPFSGELPDQPKRKKRKKKFNKPQDGKPKNQNP